MSHLGRPQKERLEDGSIDVQSFSLEQIALKLQELLGRDVIFSASLDPDIVSTQANALNPGEILLLENTRFHKGEESGDENYASSLAVLADVYINDAFGTAHRAHASTSIVAKFFPKGKKGFGYLMVNELENAKKLSQSPERPYVAILGGAKISDKILLIEKLIDRVDTIIVGGGMAYTFIKAMGGQIGDSLLEVDRIDAAFELIAKAKTKGVELCLPPDTVINETFSEIGEQKTVPSYQIPEHWMGLDIGNQSIEFFCSKIRTAKSILWNGPMGVFEMAKYSVGTFKLAECVGAATKKGAFSLIGGGDSASAIKQAGLEHEVSFVSTGGGAMLTLLEGKPLPGIQSIIEN